MLTFLSVPPVGLSHTPGSPMVTVLNAGVYKVTYEVNDSSSTPFALSINGVALPGSVLIPLTGGFFSGVATLALAVGDTLEIVLLGTSGLVNRVLMDVLKVS
ncbi:hypothetical protein SAMN05443270_4399 [Lacrimispora sphenoides]|nr:hypothetical protein SAMN05443270_4399 [Lacrimispora sphenoides]